MSRGAEIAEAICKMMDSKKKCRQCGGQMDRDGKRVRLCTSCVKKNKREYERKRDRSPDRAIITLEGKPKPFISLSEYNRMQRERGLTYGGKPILNACPLEPKFMEGAWPKWERKGNGEL